MSSTMMFRPFLQSKGTSGNYQTITPRTYGSKQGLMANFCAAKAEKPKFKTLEFQDKLPKLPVAPLQKSIDKYLKTVKPFVNEKEFEHTKSVAAEFTKPGGMGEKLHKLLEERAAASKTHWLEAWWDYWAYFEPRYPIVINVNYFFHYDLYPAGQTTQTKRAASLVSGALEFKRLLETQELQPDMMKDTPLDMSAYHWMFNTTRIPHQKEDFLRKFENKVGKHIVVARKNMFYWFDVVKPGNDPYAFLSTEDIEKQLQRVIQLADADAKKGVEPPIGVLTADERTRWADTRDKFLAVEGGINKAPLEKLESGIFMVCLDDISPVTREDIGRALWHGSGRNRWFDKSFQLIVFENGVCGLNGEHSKLDGMPVKRLSDFIMFDHKPQQQKNVSILPSPSKINFTFNSDIVNTIRNSESDFEKFISGFGLRVLPFTQYGQNFMKKSGLSPDAYVQMAIQMSYYKIHKKFVATYESAMTKKYLAGRTEVGRTVSEDSCAFVRSMNDSKATPQQRYELLKKACDSHSAYMKEAVDGYGCDRLLLGLKMICLEKGWELPEIYKDPAFSRSNHWAVSTSQLSSEGFYVGFGPVVDDGYGVCYSIRDNMVTLTVSSHENNPSTPVQGFYKALHESLIELQTLCEAAAPAPKPKAKL